MKKIQNQDVDLLSKGRIVCVGDFMLDKYVGGEVTRLSPEAPIPVLEVGSELEVLGGAGNVVKNLDDIGVDVIGLGVVGDDSVGARLCELVSLLRGSHLLRLDAVRKSTVKTRFRSGNQQIIRVDDEERTILSEESQQWLLKQTEDALSSPVDVLILSDYGKGVLQGDIASKLIAIAKAKGAMVVADPKGRDMQRYKGADYITPNRRELVDATGKPCSDLSGVVSAARELIAHSDVQGVLATLSDDGMVLVGPHEYKHFSDEVREVYDVGGAGDTVVAVFSAALAAGLSPVKSAHMSNIAAGVVVGKAGTASVYRHEIREALQNHHRYGTDCVLGESAVLLRVAEWRKRGLTIGFANGCFDVLHAGHVKMLSLAREQCDRLLLAVNDDASVRNLKGDNRPVNALEERMAILSHLRGVDGVLSFSEATPIRLIRSLRPNIIFKGGDYNAEDVVGFEQVKEWGGRVEIVPLMEGVSTTNIIEKMV